MWGLRLQTSQLQIVDMNTFGNILRFTDFGESHGEAIGGVLDGFPAGLKVDYDEIDRQMARRRPGQSAITTARNEADKVEFLSGIFDGKTTGAPIAFIIRNTNARSVDYDAMAKVFRPSHADYTYYAKYGIRDHRGGGRSSARETAARVAAGALARQALACYGIYIRAFTYAIGPLSLSEWPGEFPDSENAVRCPDGELADRMEQLILSVKADGDSIGGIVGCSITGVPAGLGEPVAGRLDAMLASAMLSINASKGFEYGMGFEGSELRGSQAIDRFTAEGRERVSTISNFSGGIQGGISNGEEIYFRVAFKPVATLLMPIETIDVDGNPTVLNPRGRHDPCVVPRAVPVVEAMAALTLLDAILAARCSRL